MVIRHDAGTLPPTDPCYRNGWMCVTAYTADGRLVRTQFMTFQGRVDELGDGKYRVYIDPRYPEVKNLRAGLKLVIPDRKGMRSFQFNDCTLCSAEDIHIRNSYNAAFATGVARWCSWKRCKVYPLPGLYLSSNADGLIGVSSAYVSEFEGRNLGDDCFNAYSLGYKIAKIKGAAVTPGKIHGWTKPGSMLMFMSLATGQYLAAGVVKNNSDTARTEYEDPLPQDINTVETVGGRGHIQSNVMGQVLYDEVPDILNDPRAFGIGTVLSNCRYSQCRSGMNIQYPCSIVENNVFDNMAMGFGIAFGCLPYEGIPPYHVVIRGNTVTDSFGGIRSKRFIRNAEPARCAPISGIVLENNRFENTVQGMNIANVADSVIRGNSVGGQEKSSFNERSNQVVFERCRRLRFRGNTLRNQPFRKGNITAIDCSGLEW